jgi:hypothetical protein
MQHFRTGEGDAPRSATAVSRMGTHTAGVLGYAQSGEIEPLPLASGM